MFEIALDPLAESVRVESDGDTIRLVLPPDHPFEHALVASREGLLAAVEDHLRALFGSRECPRDYRMENERLVISRRADPSGLPR